MKKGMGILLSVLGVIVFCGFLAFKFFTGTYNTIVKMEEGIKGSWAQVENQYQRRLDLIPNLVSTVKGYATHEEGVLTDVATARARAGGVMEVDENVLDNPAAFERFQEAQSSLGGALQRLLMVTENYPNLKADQQFMTLQNQLEGTENRISVERKRFNDAVQSYNSYIRMFPQALIANLGGFAQKEYFKSDAGASSAPKVSF